ncbi:MAG: ATP-binding cassette domain-containing protein [Peptostreptococcus porci]|uniref:ATP-binding cassette domain-containing protein n=1 Tax=Peptostreptococcus porci TaxID=2652282 RepID=A0A6N7XGQ1_9FIRM|nr:ATP-binding cassette domain-containing protein [Peptostreptococcus porci]MDY5479995.1 ATP-binding cassette domain-containing protein [Peptostreptococcus porci]MST62564.1 ATP-binding cassette domain-containing protein [Peptostreptococcus porci]
MILLKDVSYEWEDGRTALKNINLEIKKGEFVLISGKSGSGKSTLGSVMNGLIPHYYKGKMQGEAFASGKDIRKLLLHEVGHIVGTVFQDPRSQFFTTTTDEEIAFGLQTICKSRDEIKQRVEEVYVELDIEELKGKSVFELSSGQKQKIAIASIYAMNPKVLILDEPSANLDMKATFDLFLILEKLKKKGTTVVLIEHRLYYVKSLFDRFLLVKDGEIVQDLSREEVIHLEGAFWADNGLRTLELEEYRISEKKDLYQLNDESIIGKGLKFCYPSATKVENKQNEYILNHLDFNMECGKAIGLIGLNGTGKTTFARVISGLEKIKEGTIWAGKDKSLNHKDLMDMSYFVFQDSDYQLFSESVLDEMLLGISNKDKKENTQKAKSILNVLGLYKYIDKHPFALSRGEKQRLTIACGMMKRAKVFIYDEPTSGCDKDSMLSVAKLIEEQLKNGTTVLVISHDFEFLANTVSKLWVMEDGKIEKVLNMSESNKFLILDKMRGGREFDR